MSAILNKVILSGLKVDLEKLKVLISLLFHPDLYAFVFIIEFAFQNYYNKSQTF
jgi:hypothetical protein